MRARSGDGIVVTRHLHSGLRLLFTLFISSFGVLAVILISITTGRVSFPFGCLSMS